MVVIGFDSSGNITQLAVWIQGKTDQHKVVLLIHRRDDVPEFCLVRQILAWVHYSDYSSGPLFPSSKGSFEPISYTTFRSRARQAALIVKNGKGVYGTHYLRKTAWLLGAWGGGSDVDLAAASRHKTLSQAPRYKLDASAMREFAINTGDPMASSAPRWRAIHISSLQT
jgi:integrase